MEADEVKRGEAGAGECYMAVSTYYCAYTYSTTYCVLLTQVRKHQPDGRFMACVYGADGDLDEEWLEYAVVSVAMVE